MVFNVRECVPKLIKPEKTGTLDDSLRAFEVALQSCIRVHECVLKLQKPERALEVVKNHPDINISVIRR